jgi:hypothetical protein
MGAELCRLARETMNARGPDQGLLRDSASIDASTAEGTAVDERDRGAERQGRLGGRDAGGSTSEHD